jgi:deoxycytidylate deaminase
LENSKDRELIMQMIRKEISNDSVRFCRAQHAERNAINQLATSGAHIESRHSRDKIIESINAEDSFNNIPGSSIFVTAFPCNNCAIEIASTGISKVYYMSDYLNSTVDNSDQQKTLDFLESKNIYIRKVVIRPEILLLNTYNMYHRETISRSLAKPNEFDIEELLNN